MLIYVCAAWKNSRSVQWNGRIFFRCLLMWVLVHCNRFLPKKDEDDYLFELEKFNCSYVQRGLALVRKKLIDDSVKKNKGYWFRLWGLYSVYRTSRIVKRTVLIEIAQGKTLMLYSLVVLQQNVSLSLNLVMPLGTTSSFWFNFKLIEFIVFFFHQQHFQFPLI